MTDDQYIMEALRTAIIHLDELERSGHGKYSQKAEFLRIYRDMTQRNIKTTKQGYEK